MSTAATLLRTGVRRQSGLLSRRCLIPSVSSWVPVQSDGSSRLASFSTIASSNDAHTPPQRPKKKSLWNRFVDTYSIPKQQQRIVMADRLFRFAQIRADDPIWYGPGHIGREFRPRHAILTMHLWFLHKRLISDMSEEHNNSLLIQEEFFDIFWDDTQKRIRERGVPELSVNRQLERVQQYTFQHLTHYDHAFSEYEFKPKSRHEELRTIVWRHILLSEPDVNACSDQVERLALYIESQYNNIMHRLPDEYWREGRLAWVDIPDFSDLRDHRGKPIPDVVDDPKDPLLVLPPGWNKALTLAGEPFYWNPSKGVTQWNLPDK